MSIKKLVKGKFDKNSKKILKETTSLKNIISLKTIKTPDKARNIESKVKTKKICLTKIKIKDKKNHLFYKGSGRSSRQQLRDTPTNMKKSLLKLLENVKQRTDNVNLMGTTIFLDGIRNNMTTQTITGKISNNVYYNQNIIKAISKSKKMYVTSLLQPSSSVNKFH